MLLNIKPLTRENQKGKKQVKQSVVVVLLILTCFIGFFIHKGVAPLIKKIRTNEVQYLGKNLTATGDVLWDVDNVVKMMQTKITQKEDIKRHKVNISEEGKSMHGWKEYGEKKTCHIHVFTWANASLSEKRVKKALFAVKKAVVFYCRRRYHG